MTALIPSSEVAEFMRLPSEVRSDVESWLAELGKVTKPIQKSLATVAARMGVSIKTARRKYDAWRQNRHWLALVNRAKVPEDRGLDREFIAYWQGLCKQNGRKCLPAYREFVRQFKAGEQIPGIDVTVCRQKLPPGYSYDNLMRFRPSDFELKAARVGRSASAEFRPKVSLSRRDLAVGRAFMFDDMWHDFEICKIGQRAPRRLLRMICSAAASFAVD